MVRICFKLVCRSSPQRAEEKRLCYSLEEMGELAHIDISRTPPNEHDSFASVSMSHSEGSAEVSLNDSMDLNKDLKLCDSHVAKSS